MITIAEAVMMEAMEETAKVLVEMINRSMGMVAAAEAATIAMIRAREMMTTTTAEVMADNEVGNMMTTKVEDRVEAMVEDEAMSIPADKVEVEMTATLVAKVEDMKVIRVDDNMVAEAMTTMTMRS